jgi:hypothetical protein
MTTKAKRAAERIAGELGRGANEPGTGRLAEALAQEQGMSGHTAGPWAYDRRAGAIRAADGDTVAEVGWGGTDAEADANARLIAAAPDLLAVAQKAMHLFALGVGAVSTSDATKANSDRCIEEAKKLRDEFAAAIAKAGGAL